MNVHGQWYRFFSFSLPLHRCQLSQIRKESHGFGAFVSCYAKKVVTRRFVRLCLRVCFLACYSVFEGLMTAIYYNKELRHFCTFRANTREPLHLSSQNCRLLVSWELFWDEWHLCYLLSQNFCFPSQKTTTLLSLQPSFCSLITLCFILFWDYQLCIIHNYF